MKKFSLFRLTTQDPTKFEFFKQNFTVFNQKLTFLTEYSQKNFNPITKIMIIIMIFIIIYHTKLIYFFCLKYFNILIYILINLKSKQKKN